MGINILFLIQNNYNNDKSALNYQFIKSKSKSNTNLMIYVGFFFEIF